MPQDSNHPDTPSRASLQRENAALRRLLALFSRQLYGRVMPGLFTLLPEDDASSGETAAGEYDENAEYAQESSPGVLHETAAAYHVSEPTSIPSDFPSEDVTLKLPAAECAGMSPAGFERTEAVAARPAVVLRNIRRTLYVSNDGSGVAAAARAPALFPDPCGGPLVFDASFAALTAELRVEGMTYRAISERMMAENGLTISEEALRGLVSAAAETIMPVCNKLIVRTLPDWMNIRRMFEEAKTGGDWFAEDFLKKIHALRELEEYARLSAERNGGSPEDLYRERRAVRARSRKITAEFFELCRRTLPGIDAQSPLAETIRHALELESRLCEFLYDPRLELSCANPETPVADPFTALAVCADECRMRGVSFRVWLEHALIMLKQPEPPPPETLFPR